MNHLPKALTENIVVQDLRDELLIYNRTTDQAYSLNRTSKLVFDSCDGVVTFDELKRRHQFTDDLIYLALDELKKQNLIEGDYASPFAGMNRREVIRQVGLASMIALPVIASLAAPGAIQAASCAAQFQACTAAPAFSQGTCCANLRCSRNTSQCQSCMMQNSAYRLNTSCSSPADCTAVCNGIVQKNFCCNSGSATSNYNSATGGTQSVSCLCP